MDKLSIYQSSFRSNIKQLHKLSIVLQDKSRICRRCQIHFSQLNFIQHQKKCSRQQRKGHTQRGNSQNLSFCFSQISKKISDINDSQNTNLIIETILKSVLQFQKATLTIFISKFSMSPNTYMHILLHKCLDFNKSIGQIFSSDQLQQIRKDQHLGLLIFTLQDLFDVKKVQKRMADLKFKQYRLNKVRTKINKLMKDKKLPQLYIKKPVQYKTKNSKLPLMFRQLKQLVLSLFMSRRKNNVHFGLDLLIAFHCTQRLPASKYIVEKLINQILQSDKTSAELKAVKTGNSQLLTINQEIKQMLKEFGWKQFLFSQRGLGRISEYFNFSIISLRKGCYCQMFANIQQKDLTKITFHKAEQNLNIYLKSIQSKVIKNFHQSLSIFNQSKKQVEIQDIDKVFPKMLAQLPGDKTKIQLSLFKNIPQRQLILDNSVHQFQQNQIQQQHEIPNQNNEMINQDDGSSSQQTSNSQQSYKSQKRIGQERIKIAGMEYQVQNGKFTQSIFQQNIQNSSQCVLCCLQKCQKVCIFCGSSYHNACIHQFCKCMKFIIPKNFIRPIITQNVDTLIKMPEKYFNKNLNLLNEVRKLIHLRGFYYCTSAIIKEKQDISINLQLQNISLPRYQEYEAGHYFPPLFFSESGDENIFGTGIGLFSKQQIQQNTFIGQYGGTFVNEDQLILLKRKDMSMQIFSKQKQKFYIGADHHLSYVQLINGGKANNSNCKIIKTSVNGKLKLLLYATKKIEPNSQILYDYGWSHNFKYQKNIKIKIHHETQKIENIFNNLNPNFQINNVVPQGMANIHQEKPVNINQTKNLASIKNKGNRKKQSIQSIKIKSCQNCCYADSVIVILKLLSHYFKPSKNKFVSEILSSKAYVVENITNKFSNYLRKNQKQQEDFDQFFVYMRQLLGGDSPFSPILIKTARRCKICYLQSYNLAYQYQYRSCQVQVKTQNNFQTLKLCERCTTNTNHQVNQSVESTPKLLVLSYSSTQLTFQKRMNIIQVKKIKHKDLYYKPIIVVYHHGQQTTCGHYVTHDLESNKVYDQGKVRKLISQEDTSVCMIILQRQEQKQPMQIKNFGDSGVFIKNKNGLYQQNVTKYYNIASITKVITYFTCQKLRNIMNLPINLRFGLPKSSHIFGLNAGLKQNQQFTIQELYNLMLVPSACDAAYCLSFFIGQKYKQFLKLQKIGNVQLFINQMRQFCFRLKMYNTFIQDAWGIGNNLSCVNDMELLLIEISKTNQLINILKKIQVNQQFYNTNKFSEKLPGKTGTHATGSSFIGQNQFITLIILQSTKQKIEFQIENELNKE